MQLNDKIISDSIKDIFGVFDFIFIDGDHCADGVRQDTQLAQSLITDNGLICWHDANPKDKYRNVRLFIEQELPLNAVATMDDYSGGIACWSKDIEKQVESLFQNSPS